MKPSESIKPITYLKTHTSDVVREVNDTRGTMIITQNGEAKVVVQDISSYEQTQETLALLKLLAQGRRSAEEGRTKQLRHVIHKLQSNLANSKA